ncbi:hypothetical protein HHX47_DHR9000312, partial [Lentinula edodes]
MKFFRLQGYFISVLSKHNSEAEDPWTSSDCRLPIQDTSENLLPKLHPAFKIGIRNFVPLPEPFIFFPVLCNPFEVSRSVDEKMEN